MTRMVPKVGDYVEILKDHSGMVKPGKQGLVTGVRRATVLEIMFPDVLTHDEEYSEKFADDWLCPIKDLKVICRWR